eukprot:121093_1
MTNESSLEASINIKYYIRVLFSFCCVIWLFVALDHYHNDGLMFDYEYLSTPKIMRRLLADQESYKQWNAIVKNEFSAANLHQIDSKTSERIMQMINHDKAAITENSDKFHKLLPEYILAKRQVDIQNAELNELTHKRNKEESKFKAIQLSTQKEQKAIEMVSESGTKQTDLNSKLEKELEDELSLLKNELDQIHHLIHSTTTTRDQWLKKSQTLHQQLLSIMKLDQTDRSIESVLNRLVHYSSNNECDWQQKKSECSFMSDIDVGIQFDSHYFIAHNPPNHINLKTIEVQKSAENTDGLCRIKVFIGVNEACNTHNLPQQNHVTDSGITETDTKPSLREICTASLGKTTNDDDECVNCNGVNIDLKELEKSLLPNEKQSESLYKFCVVMKRYYPQETGQNQQCKGKGIVELNTATHIERGHINCPSPKIYLKNKKEKTLKRTRNDEYKKIEGVLGKSKHDDFNEQESFAWKRMVGYWPYCATLLAGIVGVGSFFILYL